MTDRHDAAVDAYIRRLSELQAAQTQTQTMTQADLDAIALELGLTEADLAHARQLAQDYVEQGNRYRQLEQWDEAVEALEQAVALTPLDYDSLYALAEALSHRYQAQGKEAGNDADRQRAIAIAQQCRQLRPNDVSLLKIAGQSLPPLQPSRGPWLRGRRLAGAVGLALGAGLIGLDLMGVIQLDGQPSPSIPETEIVSDLVPGGDPAASETATPVGTPVADFGDSSPRQAQLDIPLQFEDSSLAIDPRLSRLSNYDERSFYKLEGVLINQGSTELVSLNLKVEYLDATGQTILEESATALRDSDAPLRPGDTHTVSLIEEMPPSLAAIRLTVATRDHLPAPASYETAATVDYNWDVIPPANMGLEMTVRKDQFDQYTRSAYHDAVYAFTNTGEVAIRRLKLRMDFYNDRDTPIGQNEVLVVYGDDAPILPGETRPARTLQSLSKDYARYTITIVEAE